MQSVRSQPRTIVLGVNVVALLTHSRFIILRLNWNFPVASRSCSPLRLDKSMKVSTIESLLLDNTAFKTTFCRQLNAEDINHAVDANAKPFWSFKRIINYLNNWLHRSHNWFGFVTPNELKYFNYSMGACGWSSSEETHQHKSTPKMFQKQSTLHTADI